ncbi:hypothetical protein D623_10013634 [Myotis brandtii]|uniref:Uncharacterized protein n=1 Tax=Myotis brandtii TaxID=109478 RepID=S7N5K9_MYOBR|nr:hypothetical protein D623_10013634 [Myotis brandtii]
MRLLSLLPVASAPPALPGQSYLPRPAQHSTTDPSSFGETEGIPHPRPRAGSLPPHSWPFSPGPPPRNETIASPVASSPLPWSTEPPPYTNPWAGSVGSAFRRHLNATPPLLSDCHPQLPPALAPD